MHKPLLSLMLFLCIGIFAQAQTPANDDCANAIPVSLDVVVDFTTLGANSDGPNHPDDCQSSGVAPDSTGADVWYTFTAPNTSNVRWSICGTADYDTKIFVYNAGIGCTPTSGDVLACSEDGQDCANSTSVAEFEAEANSTYLLRLGGWVSPDSASSGTGTFFLEEFIPDPSPENNDCVDAIEVFLGTEQYFETTGADTDGPDHEDNPCFQFGSVTADDDIWYTFTPDFTGSVLWSTCDMINFDSRLAIYGPNGTCPFTDEDLYSCNDDGPGCTGFTSSLIFDVEEGQTYHLRLGGYNGEDGIGNFDLIEIIPPEPPVNDLCAAPDTSWIISREEADEFDVIVEGTTLNGSFVSEDYIFPVCLTNQDGGEFSDVWYEVNTLGNTEIEVRLNAVEEGGIFYLDFFELCDSLVDTTAVANICVNTDDENSFVVDTVGQFPPVPTDYLIRVTTRLTSDPPGPFWFQLVGDIVSDVEEAELEDFRLFPNPTADFVRTTFGLNESSQVEYKVFNTLGQMVKRENMGLLNQGRQDLNLDVSTLAPGIYILNIGVDGKQKTAKFIKQ